MVDWSARSKPSPKAPAKDAIYICHSNNFEMQNTEYFRTRRAALNFIEKLIEKSLALKERIFIGFDFAFSYPAGFSKSVTLSSNPFSIWDVPKPKIIKSEIEEIPCNSGNNVLAVLASFIAELR